MRPCVEIFTGDGEVADPVSAHEAKTYTHKGNVFRMHNCVGFYPTGGTHGVSATDEGMPPLKVETGEGGNAPAVAFNGYQRTKGSITWPLGACDGRKVEVGVRQGFSVRRLTPRECERLQGFPDDYTLVPYRKGLSADGHRYKALGNSMAVPVMRWIGARIYLVDQLDQGE
jgi:site-specific DNA-cytosine methylase